jgi:hypothetical protein
MVRIDPNDLIGRTFLKDLEADEQWFRAPVVRDLVDEEDTFRKVSDYMKFICEVPNSTVDEILTYNEILEYSEKDNMDIDSDNEQLYKFCRITAHQGPLWTLDKDYKGSTYNVFIEWETGETTYETLDLIVKDDLVTCANYAKQHNLLNTAGWKQFNRITESNKKVERMVHQAKLRSY